ncbi:MAG TPA: type III-B CRISPR module-associated protein Cmr5 [bacterium]|nr:type III-B CRISPR module-associated protein Cmr5 [bacterium]
MSRTESVVNKLEKGRAECAYKCVEEAINRLNNKEQKEYRSYSRKIPTMILTNGLGQTLAFIKSKSEKGNAYSLIYDQLTEYMKSDSTLKIQMPSGESDLVKWVISSDSVTYRYIEQEILAFLNWLKRFAEGLIEEEG